MRRGGIRTFSGRRPDAIRENFQIIQTQENLKKPAQLQQAKCKVCAQTVTARAERMRDHKEKCERSFQVMKASFMN